jgi:hypothetical protein
MDNPTSVGVTRTTSRPHEQAWRAARPRPLPAWLLVLSVPFWLTVWGANGGRGSGRRLQTRAVAPERCEASRPVPTIRFAPVRGGYPPGDYPLPKHPRLRPLGPTPERLLLGY